MDVIDTIMLMVIIALFSSILTNCLERPRRRSSPYQEGEGSTFQSNGKIYLLDKIFELAHTLKVSRLFMANVEWQLKIWPTDEDRVNRTNTKYPIIVVHDHGDQFIVVDGLHRLAKLKRQQAKFVQCIIVPEKLMELALIK